MQYGLLVAVIVCTVVAAALLLSRIETQTDCSIDAKAQMLRLEQALEFYKLDMGRYPSQDEGLVALVEQPSGVDASVYNPGGYIKRDALMDVWGHPFSYTYPGECHPEIPTIRSLGADGVMGGWGEDADVSSCQET